MKLHRLFIWLLAIGYGVLVYANEENAPSAQDPFALRQEALRDFDSGKAEDAQIADFMCLEAASVYTVRYRIRKKMGSEHPFPY